MYRNATTSDALCLLLKYVFYLGLGVSICLDRVSIETLDLDTGRELVSTVEITNLNFIRLLNQNLCLRFVSFCN